MEKYHDIQGRKNLLFQLSGSPGGNAFIRSPEVFAYPGNRIHCRTASLAEENTDRRRRIMSICEHSNLTFPALEGGCERLQRPAMQADDAGIVPRLLDPGKASCTELRCGKNSNCSRGNTSRSRRPMP